MVRNESEGYLWHFKRLIHFGMPLVLAQLFQMGIGVTDTIIVGRLGAHELAQIGLGATFNLMIILIPIGVAISTSILVGTAQPKNDFLTMQKTIRASFGIHLMIFIITLPLMWFAEDVLRLLNQPEESLKGAALYVRIMIPAVLFIYLSNVLKHYLLGLERGNASLLIAFIGFVVNIFGNYILVFGKFGFPALGLVGSATASLITNAMVLLMTLMLVSRDPVTKAARIFDRFWEWEATTVKRLLRMGLPMSFGVWSEVGMFMVASLMVGWLGVNAFAAHMIVLNIASLTFTIPLGLSIAASIRSGNAVGRKDRDGLLRGATVAYGTIMVLMSITALSFWFKPETFINLFQDPNKPYAPEVVKLAAVMFTGAAIFQIFDGAQVVGISVLRGIQDAAIPAALVFVAYWLIGVPMGYVLAFKYSLGGLGVWLGLASGLSMAAIFLGTRLYHQTRANAFARRLEKMHTST